LILKREFDNLFELLQPLRKNFVNNIEIDNI